MLWSGGIATIKWKSYSWLFEEKKGGMWQMQRDFKYSIVNIKIDVENIKININH